MGSRPEVGRVSLSDRQRLRTLGNCDYADAHRDGNRARGVPLEGLRACGVDWDPGVDVRKIAVVPRDRTPGRRLYPGATRTAVLLYSSELNRCRCLLILDRNSSTCARRYSC